MHPFAPPDRAPVMSGRTETARQHPEGQGATASTVPSDANASAVGSFSRDPGSRSGQSFQLEVDRPQSTARPRGLNARLPTETTQVSTGARSDGGSGTPASSHDTTGDAGGDARGEIAVPDATDRDTARIAADTDLIQGIFGADPARPAESPVVSAPPSPASSIASIEPSATSSFTDPAFTTATNPFISPADRPADVAGRILFDVVNPSQGNTIAPLTFPASKMAAHGEPSSRNVPTKARQMSPTATGPVVPPDGKMSATTAIVAPIAAGSSVLSGLGVPDSSPSILPGRVAADPPKPVLPTPSFQTPQSGTAVPISAAIGMPETAQPRATPSTTGNSPAGAAERILQARQTGELSETRTGDVTAALTSRRTPSASGDPIVAPSTTQTSVPPAAVTGSDALRNGPTLPVQTPRSPSAFGIAPPLQSGADVPRPVVPDPLGRSQGASAGPTPVSVTSHPASAQAAPDSVTPSPATTLPPRTATDAAATVSVTPRPTSAQATLDNVAPSPATELSSSAARDTTAASVAARTPLSGSAQPYPETTTRSFDGAADPGVVPSQIPVATGRQARADGMLLSGASVQQEASNGRLASAAPQSVAETRPVVSAAASASPAPTPEPPKSPPLHDTAPRTASAQATYAWSYTTTAPPGTQTGTPAIKAGVAAAKTGDAAATPPISLAATILAGREQPAPMSEELRSDGIAALTAPAGSASAGQTAPIGAPASPHTPSATAQAIAAQLAEVAARAGRRETEIALAPAELGRVRMRLSGSDGTLTVAILVERPDTLDLMRRHIAELGAEFREQGYGTVTFSFEQAGTGGSGQDRQADGQSDETARRAPAPVGDTAAATPPPVYRTAGGALDLRL